MSGFKEGDEVVVASSCFEGRTYHHKSVVQKVLKNGNFRLIDGGPNNLYYPNGYMAGMSVRFVLKLDEEVLQDMENQKTAAQLNQMASEIYRQVNTMSANRESCLKHAETIHALHKICFNTESSPASLTYGTKQPVNPRPYLKGEES